MRARRMTSAAWWLVIGLLAAGCSSMPPLEQQRRWVKAGDLRLHEVTPRAVVETWGKPTYQHHQFTHFYGMPDGRLIPQARMALGESPQGWETGLVSGDALFLAYTDPGRYLVFIDEALVYQEEMTPEKIHAVGKSWAYESQFKTRLETSPALK